MRSLKISLLVITSIIIVLCGWFFLAGMITEKTVLSNSYYRDLLAETDLSSRLHQEIQEALPEIILEVLAEELEDKLTGEENILMFTMVQLVSNAITESFDEVWLENQFILVIDDILALVKGEQQTLTAVINLHDNMEQFEENLIANLQTFSAEKMEALNIPVEQTGLVAEQILKEIDLPDQIYLADLINGNGQRIPEEIENTISYLQNIRGLYHYMPYIVFMVMLFLLFLLVGFAGGLKWFGAAVIFFSITFLIGMHLINNIIPPVIFVEMDGKLPFSPEIFAAITDFTVNRVSFIPLIITAIGLILVIFGTILGRTTRKAWIKPKG